MLGDRATQGVLQLPTPHCLGPSDTRFRQTDVHLYRGTVAMTIGLGHQRETMASELASSLR